MKAKKASSLGNVIFKDLDELHDKDKVYLKGKDKIVPPFRFGVEDVATKMWFHKLAYPGQCLTNSVRKYAKEPKVKFTTTDCLFFKTIHALYEKFIAQKKDLSLITAQHAIADYIRGRKMLCGSPWHLCDHVLFIIHMETESHWILGRLNIEKRRMYMYNSLSTAMKDSAAIKACQPFAVLLPHFFALFDEFKKENKPVCLDPFEVVKVDGLPQQTSNDCGCFVASFAEYFINMKPIPPIFDVEKHRDRLAVLFYKYARMKEVDFIDSEDEAPPKDYVHNHRQVVVSIISQESLLLRIPNRTVPSNLTFLTGQHIKLTHLSHGDHKFLEKQSLIHRETLHDLLSLAVSVEILIGGEKSLTIHEIDVVFVVEGVGCSEILEGEGVEVFSWAYGFEILGEGLVHDWILGWVETVVEGSAVGDSDGVTA
ncbi:hypothetical protein F8388_000780 [Cannabis sativa]|uniref:Ubiquitin-like protease family profile domain-containing protein n=1 Tax=Cannabis sativa TaxID=3483 RepID=A0A7J6E145_CANSA|nr:hypothetical protein F8388_000780 [Cannabis sativa]